MTAGGRADDSPAAPSGVGHVLAHRVAFADTDAIGRIHWTAVFRWAELAEHDLLRQLSLHDVRAFPRVCDGGRLSTCL